VSRGRPRKASLGKRGKVAKKVESDEEEDEDYRPSKRVRGRPKKVKTESETPTPKGRKKAEPKATPSKVVQSSKSSTDWNDIDLSSDAKTSNDSPWTHKFSSWNVNGIRAWLKGDGLEYITQECPDIFSIQETKCSEADLPESELEVSGYHTYWYSADQKGYSGTGLYCKEKPIDVKYGIGIDKHDNEGRVITAEFEKFYFVTAYVPNSGDKLQRLGYRVKEWDPDFRSYLQTLDKDKPVILCGDLNVAHNEIDIANPKSNQRSSGFTKEERESFTTLLTESSFIDSFRTLYPDKKDSYSYWSYRSNARANNKGWYDDHDNYTCTIALM
jgi:AP endonuclease-1